MSPERWQKVQSVVDKVLEHEPSTRSSVADELCGEDAELRRDVENILGPLPSEDVIRIGSYRIVERLGQGGMGVVYLAERESEYHQQVAIKVGVNLHGSGSEKRFYNERQILAQLDHPGIAKLLDGGTTADGYPYFVMDYVEGVPITTYCEEQELPTDTRLALFRKVCDAVAAAHQIGVIHRDIKPPNILVTKEGTPKLLDFGIAKLLDPADFPLTVEATTLHQRPMTPGYASPEQIQGEPVTASSDVYCLGVLLYRMLTGRMPLALKGLSLVDMERIILTKTPRKPRDVAPERGLTRDLDFIALKALAREPEDRYASVEELVADLDRYRENKPIQARQVPVVDRIRRFLGRQRLVLATCGLVMIIAVAAYLLGSREVDQEISPVDSQQLYSEGLAHLQRFEAAEARDLLEKVVGVEPGNALAHVALSRAWSMLGNQEAASTRAAQAHKLIDNLSQEDAWLVLGRYHETLGQWSEAVEAYEGLFYVFPSRVDYGLLLAQAITESGRKDQARKVLGTLADLDERDPRIDLAIAVAQDDCRQLLAVINQALTKGREQGLDVLVAEGLLLKARCGQRQGDYDSVWSALVEAGHLFREKGLRRKAADVLLQMGMMLHVQGDIPEAERSYREVLALRREIGDVGGRIEAARAIAFVEMGRGELTKGRRIFEDLIAEAREIHNPFLEFICRQSLIEVLLAQGLTEEAAQQIEAARERKLNFLEWPVQETLDFYAARITLDRGDLPTARKLLEDLLPELCDSGAYPSACGVLLHWLAEVSLMSADLAQAKIYMDRTEGYHTFVEGKLGRYILRMRWAFAAGDFSGAERLAVESETRYGDVPVVEHKARIAALEARALVAEGDLAAAREALVRATPRRNSEEPRLRTEIALAEAELAAGEGDHDDALRVLRAALQDAERVEIVENRLALRLALGRLELAQGDSAARERLEALAAEASGKGFQYFAALAKK